MHPLEHPSDRPRAGRVSPEPLLTITPARSERQGERPRSPLRIDLHCHTTHSDGELTPEVLVKRALSVGVSHLAVTDHDAVSGLMSCAAAARGTEITILGGIEVTSQLNGREIHVLGHNILPDAPGLRAWCDARREERRTRLMEMTERLVKQGIDIDFADVEKEAAGATLGRPHLARVLLRQGHVASMREAFDRYLTSGRHGYVERPKPDVEEVVRLVREAGGTTSLAHPIVNKVSKAELSHLVSVGLDAVEARHPDHPPALAGQVARWAKDLAISATGGSDFHGAITGTVELGAFVTPPADYDRLLALAVERQSAPALASALKSWRQVASGV